MLDGILARARALTLGPAYAIHLRGSLAGGPLLALAELLGMSVWFTASALASSFTTGPRLVSFALSDRSTASRHAAADDELIHGPSPFPSTPTPHRSAGRFPIRSK